MSIPGWLPWVEVAFAAPSCVISFFFFVVLLLIPLPNGCKVFLYINIVALFFLALCQGFIAEWTARNNRGIGPRELYFFPLIVTHQGLYLVSTASLFYLTCERLLLCFHPTFYESHRWKLIPSLLLALILELLLVVPLTLMLQYDSTRNISLMLTSLTEIITLSLLLVCYRQSRHYYSTLFANVGLNIRYQVKEVIELTRVLIPVCVTSLCLKLTIEVLATFVFTDVSYISTSVLLLRFSDKGEITSFTLFLDRIVTQMKCVNLFHVATTMGYVEPILIMLRHRSISRRVNMIINPGREQTRSLEVGERSTEDTTRSYFAALHREWN